MQFEYQLVPSLPGLSWCARVRRGSDVVRVKHGSLVDTRPSFFVEGAWDGPFEEGCIGGCTMLSGSGAVLQDDGVLFAPPTNMYHWIASLRVGDDLLVSNSVVFVLAEAGDAPDIRYPYYHFRILQARRWGLRKQGWATPTRNGNQMILHHWRNLFVSPDLACSAVDRGRSAAPRTYAEFSGLLRGTLGSIFENAADTGRAMPLTPLASVSTGYDANAGAAVAASLGCEEAITFRGSTDEHGTDSGLDVGVHMGLRVTEYDLQGYMQRPGMIDAEFAASCTPPQTTNLVVADQQLPGKLLLSGRPGDAGWGVDQLYNFPDLAVPDTNTTAGACHTEFRLRVGFATFDVPCITMPHRPTLQQIGTSEEMRPWSVPGDYNRPLPRRLVEEAGVPRELFGQVKRAGGSGGAMTAESAADYEAFLASAEVPQWFRDHGFSHWREFPRRCLSVLYLWSRSPRLGESMTIYKALVPFTLLTDRKRGSMVNDMLHPHYMYTFHWAFERLKDRYEVAR